MPSLADTHAEHDLVLVLAWVGLDALLGVVPGGVREREGGKEEWVRTRRLFRVEKQHKANKQVKGEGRQAGRQAGTIGQ